MLMNSAASPSPADLALAKEFVRRLAQQVDPQLFTVTLFGSRARGDTGEEADLELFSQQDLKPHGSHLLPSQEDEPRDASTVLE